MEHSKLQRLKILHQCHRMLIGATTCLTDNLVCVCFSNTSLCSTRYYIKGYVNSLTILFGDNCLDVSPNRKELVLVSNNLIYTFE